MNRRDELLGYLLEREGFERQSDYSIQRREANDTPPPLSFAQERFWFFEQFEHSRPVYNGCKAVRLIGDLRVEILAECLNLIACRHEVLRATYPAPDGSPIQRITASCSIEIVATVLEQIANSELSDTIEELIRSEWLQPINLSDELPIRARLNRLNASEHLLILTLHQIAFDSQSVAIFFRELWTAYEAKVKGNEPVLPNLPVQYGDFASWQRLRVSGEVFASHRKYWIQQLSGVLPILNLPIDKPRPPVQTFHGSRLPIYLPETLRLRLKELGRENGVTLFMMLMAAFKTLLYRYTSQEDLIVGSPVLNRRLPEIENLLGSFVNTLVLRTNYAGHPSFREVLRRVRETCIRAFEHQDFPFERLVEELHPKRDIASNPIFQVMFSFQNTLVPALDVVELRSELVEIDAGITKFDLTLSLIDNEHGTTGHIEYSTDLFNRDTIERMAGHFQTLLEGITADPDQTIATLPLLTEAEWRQVAIEWNDTAVDYPKDKCIHELFEAQVERTPDAIALEFEEKQITYRELNRRANQLAHYLITLGIGPEMLVGVYVQRSIEMVVALLGILKAGGAYMPLEPTYPRERLMFMIMDAQPSLVLKEKSLNFDLGGYHGKVVCIDSDWDEIVKQSADNITPITTSDMLAYVMFTSGSTGHPKGVMIAHRGICNRLVWMQDCYRLVRSDHVLHKTPINFDVSVWEIFWPLLNGACLIVARPGGHQEGKYLIDLIANKKITVAHFVPSMLNSFLEHPGVENCRTLRLVFCSGEVLPVNLQESFFAKSEAALHNLYGPTEATIDVTHWACAQERDLTAVPIGRPIANTQIYILDSKCEPVSVGAPGELYIGGDGLARGYLNRPELTSEKFVRNPFSDDPNSRLYRTGDVAKYRTDGNIIFLGRHDNQVKIRGHRIELAEIESILNQNPGIRDCVVVARDRDPFGDKDLVGYVISNQEPSPTSSEIRRFLTEKLPDYMLPAEFVFLDSLPLTPNGKVDRNALPAPDGRRPLLDQAFVAPHTEIEELVAQIWRVVLKRDRIGVHDDFFELGGHSLLATRVVARLRSNFNIDIALRKLFELPTVAGLAQHIDALRRSGSGAVFAPIAPVARNQSLPLSFSQRRVWYLQKVDAKLTAYNIPASFRIRGDLDAGALELALNALIARHEVFRTAIFERDGQPLQQIIPKLQLALTTVDLSRLPLVQSEAEAGRLFAEDARKLHILENPPLLRATLVKLADDDHVFMLNFHHTIADGSSLAIFYRELALLYSAAKEGKAAVLPDLAIQYTDYATWQHEWLKSDIFHVQLAYWLRQLADLPGPVELLTDFERLALPTYRGARMTRQLSEELTASLKTVSRQHGTTLFMTLFAAFNILLSRVSGQEDIVLGSSIAGRNRPETEGLIGFFINALPLRTDLSGDPSVTTLFQRVREVCLEAYTNQEVPFEKIVEELKPLRDRARNPLFDILFNIADISDRSLTLPGCDVEKFSQANPDAKFNIVLQAPEVDGKINLMIVYNADLFQGKRVTLWLDQFVLLLEQVTNDPDQAISRLSLVTHGSRASLPDPTEALDATYVGSIQEFLAEQAKCSPLKLAVVDLEENWTYGEIDQCTNQLAHALIASGIKSRDTVAIYAQRSSSLIIAIFGILKAGASFFILDPAYPPARLNAYLRIARPKGWLQLAGNGEIPQELSYYLESGFRMELPLAKAEILQILSRFTDSDVGIRTEADDPAYVAFTSGSTGEPKGVLCRHGPITHFLPWQKEEFDLRESDRFAMLSGLAYSHLHRDVFTAIHLGATIYIPNSYQVSSPDLLVQWLEQNRLTVLHLTPALGQLLLTCADLQLPSVRRVFFGGDVLTRNEVAQIRTLMPNAKVGSFYGATETQRAVGYYEVTEDFSLNTSTPNKPILLGRGIKDVQLLILNCHGEMAGVSELGELFVRSPHLAEGYIGEKKRTEEMFVINPFTKVPKDRLYRTGELGRYLPDGSVEWAGRNDRRVNIRGFRIELEEIEIVLKRHPAINNAVVVMQNFDLSTSTNPKSETRLVAYVVADEEQQSLADFLRSYLSVQLPNYMVPTHFVILNSLPLSPNGKIDYQALPAVQFAATSPPATTSGNEIEIKLQAIFANVLGRLEVRLEDNFFRLGGHSLLAAMATARISDAFGVNLSLATFLETPTVLGLAKEIAALLAAGQMPTQSDKDQREEFDL